MSAANRDGEVLLYVRLAESPFFRCRWLGCGGPSFGAFRRVQASVLRFAALTTTYGFF
ncbi:MAG: hypothetical protein J0H86_01210 [Xanthomonadaceae bacterium]|nr:hypothetical protein [Xanthomonadaceae bacterium]